MVLPEVVPVGAEALAAIAKRHGLSWDSVEELRSPGIINSVYGLGAGYVLRVPRRHPGHIEQAVREAATIPIVVAAGVRTAALVAFDDTREILPVPYLIVDRIDGVDAESGPPYGYDLPGLWRAVGRDVARLHAVLPGAAVPLTGPPRGRPFADPRILVDQRARDGWISPVEARWLGRWLDALVDAGATDAPACLVHGDLQMSNVLVSNGRYRALIDWGCARLDDPVMDLVATPFQAVPELLAGHREVADLADDDRAEARILWRRLQLLLAVLPRGAAPERTWGERPVAWLMDALRFFIETDDPAWRALAPPRPGERATL
jgi:aminoglycoside phosphotransferase (APT) family kinase protein